MQFIGNNGFYQQTSPIVMQSTTPGVQFSYVGLNWSFSSPVLTSANGIFNASTSNFTLLGGLLTENLSNGSVLTFPEAGPTNTVTAGTWTLQQSSPGSGNWTLTTAGNYSDTGAGPRGANDTFTLNSVSTAHFGASNVASVTPSQTAASVLGGSSTPGGVSIGFGAATNGGTFTAQQINNPNGLPFNAITVGQTNASFTASTGNLSAHPQIWTADYTGLQAGQLATLVFNYDPSLLPAGTDQSKLGLWHYDTTANAWTFGGTVNTTNHTISFVTSSFSPFDLGIAVPEPSTLVLLSLGLVALGAHQLRRLSRSRMGA
jgi:hypothetical protein